jgi:uroporphyrinogen decarboxylase
VLAGERPDRLPVAPAVGVDHAARRAGVPLREAMSDPEVMARVILAADEAYGGDLLLVFSDVVVEAEAMGAAVEWPDGAPPRVVAPVESAAARWPDPERDGRLPVVLAAARRVLEAVGGRRPVLVSLKGPFSLAALAFGLEGLLADAHENPARARRLLVRCAESQTAYARQIVRLGGIPLLGDPFASGSMLGPRHFRELALPSLTRVIAEIHGLGSPAAVHVCGDAHPVLDGLLLAGADLLHLEHADFAKVAVAGQTVMGGVPTEALLESDEAVVGAVRAALAARPDPRRFLLSTACDVPTNAPPERVRRLVDTARELG